jgi:multidrug efflux pump subunit AcrA (membrane-fusion protein)
MTFLSYFKKHSVLAGAALAVVVFVTVIGVRIAGQRTAGDNTTSNVRQVTVSDVSSFRADRATITADGTVESLEQADLKSQVSAPVSRIAVRIGDKVTAGQTLVLFQNGDFVAQLAQAQAGLAAQTARLQEMKKGARAEDLNISQTQYEQAKQALTDTYANLVNGVNDAYAKAEDIVRKQLDSMFTNGEYQPHLNFTTSLSQNQLNAENQRLAASTELNAWKKELLMVTASSPAGDLDTALTNAKNHLNTIRTLTNAMMDALNSAVGV